MIAAAEREGRLKGRVTLIPQANPVGMAQHLTVMIIAVILAIILTVFVLQLPTDEGMYEPAKEAFPIIVGQGWRMMAAGILAYGVSVSLNVWIFSRMTANNGRLLPVRGFIAAALSQIGGGAAAHGDGGQPAPAAVGHQHLGTAIATLLILQPAADIGKA